MTNVSEDRQTQQRINLYILTMELLEEVDSLPAWFDIEQWDREAATFVVDRCQLTLDTTEKSIAGLRDSDELDETTWEAVAFAVETCSECQRQINFVWTELLNGGN